MTAIVKRSSRFTEADIDSEVVVMRLDNGDFFSLSGTGADIWRLIDGSRDRDALVAALTSEFDADESQIGSEVDDFLKQLRDMDLLAGD
ncbi:MAG TPA: PqqD family protein [Sphingomicrobium sp.]